jgi:hypothetical protein
VKTIFRSWFQKLKSRIERRLDPHNDAVHYRPVFTTSNIDYDVAHRDRAVVHGGIGAIHTLVQQLGLPQAIDQRLHLLKVHLPYHESDHVLNLAYNALCQGTCLQDIDLRRNDAAFLDLLGARRLPDPTTAGDFCRRFTRPDSDALQDAINATRLKVWAQQPKPFFHRATIDMDGTHVETTGQCKAGMDIS